MNDCCLRSRENKFQIHYNQKNLCFEENYANINSLLPNATIKTKHEELYVDQLHSLSVHTMARTLDIKTVHVLVCGARTESR